MNNFKLPGVFIHLSNQTKWTLHYLEGEIFWIARAVLGTWSRQLAVSDADVEKVIPWKNGFIEFHENNFPCLMRQIIRGYNIEVNYTGNYPEENYTGSVTVQLSCHRGWMY